MKAVRSRYKLADLQVRVLDAQVRFVSQPFARPLVLSTGAIETITQADATVRVRVAGVEAVLISFAGAAIGILAGVTFGWAGAAVMLAGIGEVSLMVPWRDLALVLGGAVVAGLLASVLPARSAVRAAPVAALAGP